MSRPRCGAWPRWEPGARAPFGAVVGRLGLRAAVATPIVVEGRYWGVTVAATPQEDFPAEYAVLAAAALHGGTDPDLLDEVAWWQSDDFWQYALFAAVA